ncbi:MAG TPA: alpha amylase C-terminal domain-containing protein, partial [Polyangiaceae bacterium]|nr:alpha amylase C-terminal domain-containing protein [Polyangiaceae bacterium]
LEAAQEQNVMSGLADALKATQGNGDAWYEMTNYPESHDEVGNDDHRISGQARGYRRNKVAAAATLFARGLPMWFMGSEYGEYRQFRKDSRGPITLHPDGDQARVRRWWDRLCELRRGNSRVQGPAPIDVKYAQDRMLAFTRGDNADLFVLLNFSPWEGQRSLAELNLPSGEYKELLNSTWGEYQISSEGEQDRSNGGWDARLIRDYTLNIPAYSALVLERA